MSTVVTLRLPDELVARVDALVGQMKPDPMSSSSSVTRADALRAALHVGLDVLERKHAKVKRRR
jgi:predicted transcriptional regulator